MNFMFTSKIIFQKYMGKKKCDFLKVTKHDLR